MYVITNKIFFEQAKRFSG